MTSNRRSYPSDEDVTAALLFGLFMGLLFGVFAASVMWWALG